MITPSERALSILLCEDEPLIMMHVSEFLKSRGFSVTETVKASEALAEMAMAKFDIIVADIELPDISGVELAKSARAIDPDIGIIFATGHLDPQNARQIPASLVLSKPFGEKQLLRAIRKLTVDS
ncbi:response regulator [Phyllobacterium zundukense]|uniref:Response regulator n=1 Tax=Phyllobacterium zundukense TaxID=1867719 RepID=A0ACD4CX01_9HYPH|nr:response regulator [Phyllobacterium zundukense]UXN58120.1 response regulator [Phyllobacterium zundukense]